MKTMPQIINLGLYDTSLIHGDIISTTPRKTSIYEIEYITEDGGTSHIEKAAYPIKKGSIIFTKPGQLRHTDLPYKCLYIHAIIEDEDLCTLLHSIPNYSTPLNPHEFENAFRALIDEVKPQNYKNDIDTAIKFFEILSLLIKTFQPIENQPLFSNKNMAIINKAINFIDENYTKNISLYDIASHVHLSKIYFHNFFLKATGQTPHQYLISKRINTVKFLLTTTDKPFSEIASDCGFTSQAYMTYIFKKKMQCTPMHYKKNLKSF